MTVFLTPTLLKPSVFLLTWEIRWLRFWKVLERVGMSRVYLCLSLDSIEQAPMDLASASRGWCSPSRAASRAPGCHPSAAAPSFARGEAPSTLGLCGLCRLTTPPPPPPKNGHVIQAWPIRTLDSLGQSDWSKPAPSETKQGHVGLSTEVLMENSRSCCWRGEPR